MELSRKIIILIYGRALSFLISLVIPIALTRLLLKEDYGSYQQLVMIYSIIQAILLLGIPQSLLYFYPRSEKENHSMLVKQTWSIVAFSSINLSSQIECPVSASICDSEQNHSAGALNGLNRFAMTMNIATTTPISASPAIIPAESKSPFFETSVPCSIASSLGSPLSVPSILRCTVRNTK